jgi:hypothetical protein
LTKISGYGNPQIFLVSNDIFFFYLTESKETQSIRLFHMTSVSGTFDVQEILNPTRVPDLVSPFPVLQSDLYRISLDLVPYLTWLRYSVKIRLEQGMG